MTPKVILKPKSESKVKNGYPWVFRDEIAGYQDVIGAGQTIDVFSSTGKFVGRGYINPTSSITVRILTHDQDEEIDRDFFSRRIERSDAIRRSIILGQLREGYDSSEGYRVVYGESDGLPGLVVDRYGEYLVMQVLTLGMEIRREMLVEALIDLFHPKGIYEKSSSSSRRLEGLDFVSTVVYGDVPEIIRIRQDDLSLIVDPQHGQKTGFFLDQRENRRFMSKYIEPGSSVLDCFCYTGAFSMYAAKRGAHVKGIDGSQRAIDICLMNAQSNGVAENCEFMVGDVFSELDSLRRAGASFDTVILDPPSFARDRSAIRPALSGYKRINTLGISLVRPGGIFISSSCTQLINEESFLKMLRSSSRSADRQLQILEVHSQPWDHPVSVSFSESRYLKFVIGRVL